MGIYDRDYYRDESSGSFYSFHSRSMVIRLIAINVVVYLIGALFFSPEQLPLQVYLAMRPRDLIEPWNWWRLLTSGFTHAEAPNHILFNMLGLFMFGRHVEGIYGPKKFLGMYLTAVLVGSAVWGLLHLSMGDVQHHLVGASGAITAVIILFCLHFPRQTILISFFFPVPAWLFGLILVGTDMVAGFRGGDVQGGVAVARDVHLMGAAYGWMFYKTQFELLSLMSSGGTRRFSSFFRRRPKLKVAAPPPSDDDELLEQQADVVLAKLHRSGESSLTAKERDVLERYSRRMQQRRR